MPLAKLMPISTIRTLLIGCGIVLCAASARAGIMVERSQVGTPDWQPVDFQMFSVDFDQFFDVAVSLLPPPEHQFHPQLGIGPGIPHAPPYDQEFSEGIARTGIEVTNEFSVEEFSGNNGVALVFMNVPSGDATQGSSPDFASGPIIPNELFPLNVASSLERQGVIDGPFDFDVPPLDSSLDPPFDVNGHSHFPIFIGFGGPFANTDLFEGNYSVNVSLRDAAGEGWDIRAPFRVSEVPEPTSLAVFGGLAIAAAGRRRRGTRHGRSLSHE